MSAKPFILGGMFGLDEMPHPRCSPPWFLESHRLALVNGRSCIKLLVDRISPKQVWLPSYLAPSMLEAVDERRTAVHFYPMTYDLAVASEEWLREVDTGDLVVLIDYFGFPCDRTCAERARERGALILEDASQALLSEHVGSSADFVLYSPRKLLGVPDGGILVLQCDMELGEISLEPPPASWWLTALNAAVRRREFDRHGGDRRWFDLYKEVEDRQPLGPFAMSDFSMTLMRHGFDYSEIASRRRRNYTRLCEHLQDIALFPQLPASVVPLGFPVRLADRAHVQRELFQRDIYPPVHWSLPPRVADAFTASRRLAGHMLTLPCDQRYDVDDMDSMAGHLRAVRTASVSTG